MPMSTDEYQQRIADADGNYAKMLEVQGEYVSQLVSAQDERDLRRYLELKGLIGGVSQQIAELNLQLTTLAAHLGAVQSRVDAREAGV